MAYSNCWMNSTPKIHQALSHKECKKLKATKDTPQSHIKFLSKNFLIPYPSLSHHQIFPKMPTTRSLIGHSFAHARSSSTAVRCLFGPGPFGAVNPSCGGGGWLFQWRSRRQILCISRSNIPTDMWNIP